MALIASGFFCYNSLLFNMLLIFCVLWLGWVTSFQADDAGSIPAARSNFLV